MQRMNPVTPRRRAAALLAALASLTALLVLAQEAPAPEPAAADEDAPPTAQAGSTDVPLEDYEASEQISEDLSVSFPVDI